MKFDLTRGATIFSHDDEKVGTLDRVIVDLESDDVTHLVAQAGLLFSEDRLIPIGMVDRTRGEDIMLVEGCKPASFPVFDMDAYRELSSEELSATVLPFSTAGFPLVATAWVDSSIGAERNAPSTGGMADRMGDSDLMATIATGDAVTAADGTSIGSVEKLVTDDSGNLESLVAVKGFIFKKRRIVPGAWIAEVTTGTVRLNRTSTMVEQDARVL